MPTHLRMLLKLVLARLGFVPIDDIRQQLNYGFSVGKRLDEHREEVEAIASKTTLFTEWWHVSHAAIQDDYLMRLYYMVHGQWPSDDSTQKWQTTREHVRPRPSVLGPCSLPEYPYASPRQSSSRPASPSEGS